MVKLVRQSQIVKSVLQDCQYFLSHLLPVCNLLVQGSKYNLQLLFVKTVLNFYCGVLLWISFILNSFIRWTSKHDNFIFSPPTFVTWYFCFLRKVCNMIHLFSQKLLHYKLGCVRFEYFYNVIKQCWTLSIQFLFNCRHFGDSPRARAIFPSPTRNAYGKIDAD